VSEPARPARAPASARRWSASPLGLAVALVTCALDQGSKLWLLNVYGLTENHPIRLAPVLDLSLTWNPGVSYGLLRGLGRWGLIVVIVGVVLLWLWLARTTSRLTAVSLGLILGGAVGNAIDRLAYGAVADFVFFHISTATWHFEWFVFNLADAAIVAGAAGLMYELLLGSRAAKPP